jgi:hypothetical protein
MGLPSYERVGGVQLPDLRDWRPCYPGFPQPVAHPRETLFWTWLDVEKWARVTGRFK